MFKISEIKLRFYILCNIYFALTTNISIYRLQREQDFLRASLRESKKLQNLEKRAANNNAGDGFINKAFDRDGSEQVEANGAVGMSAGTTDKVKSLETPRVDIGDAVSKFTCLFLSFSLYILVW